MSDIILEARDLTKSYGPKTALNGLNLTLEKGKIIGLLGPNGSGKSTFIKLCNGILQPTKGEILIGGHEVGVETKKIVSYLPERTYLDDNMSPVQMINFFSDFYEDFDADKAFDMLSSLKVNPKDKMKTMSKGTKEKVQLILVMSRQAKLYMLDEPIGGVDPAARDYILRTIISNYNPEASVIISTHLITDIEQVLDEVIFIQNGDLKLHKTVDEIRSIEGKSVDALFREVFRC
ncbi:MAG: ABC transporter ATP-binding protein [Clostridiales bacterium]|jgi:ABC-2 type transport system ATP-binding protein|uniref:ABC transporter ATP-binding protein n=1 Tax=Bovifimicola ammoniilytica TaxID=2981720 RepID=UPI0003368D7F|nr:ABC transporter ATP-binding protein [Bovifimicola ammoniilytica]MBD8942021.1 ABC transporter ATP-binding protein [Clostridiales bacterium]MCU6754149.1 ABC transporter ATP-binding protein [Bovifimicola ammoniilytica]CCZ03658.1 aBC-type multidrug transport system ATPase component [Eubacterium sp. CAG:603]SCJ81016.1 ABC-type transporter ATP-binding protein EcsA [uncultured Eubacterium sp.]